uniref:Uncharacterized protein MA_r334_jsm23CE2f n=1 Tax=Callithrix jacchus TaxID=9483 RepID=B0KWM8_CALJA|nr:hypothetical protein [Callithrix jacchus]
MGKREGRGWCEGGEEGSPWVSKQAHWPIMRNRLLPWVCRRGACVSVRECGCVCLSVCRSAPEREVWEPEKAEGL